MKLKTLGKLRLYNIKNYIQWLEKGEAADNMRENDTCEEGKENNASYSIFTLRTLFFSIVLREGTYAREGFSTHRRR